MARSLPNVPPGDIQEVLWHAVDGTEQVRRLRRHRGHAHGGRQDGFRLSRLYEEENNLRSSGGACLHATLSKTMYYLLRKP